MTAKRLIKSSRKNAKHPPRRQWLKTAGTILVGGLLVSLCGVLGVQTYRWMQESDLFLMKHLRIEGNQIISSETIRSRLALASDTHLLQIDPGILKTSLTDLPFIKQVSMRRQFPATLLVFITERKPVAFISTDRMVSLDAEGRILPFPETIHVYDVPILTGIELPDGPSGMIDTSLAIRECLALLNDLKREDIRLIDFVSEIHWKAGDEWTLYLYNAAVPVFLNKSGQLNQLHTFLMYLIHREGKIDWWNVSHVNLRFHQQIIIMMRDGQEHIT